MAQTDRLGSFTISHLAVSIQYQSFPVETTTMSFRDETTPKAFNIAAQGQRRRRATLGNLEP